jgi:signal transduction histidine kinase
MSGATIRFALHDTGIGIAAEEQEAIFEPYRKSRDGDETESEGVGLGLALSRRLARLLGGDVRVRSDLGKGSEFTLILRVADALAQHEDESPARRYLKPTIPFAASL